MFNINITRIKNVSFYHSLLKVKYYILLIYEYERGILVKQNWCDINEDWPRIMMMMMMMMMILSHFHEIRFIRVCCSLERKRYLLSILEKNTKMEKKICASLSIIFSSYLIFSRTIF